MFSRFRLKEYDFKLIIMILLLATIGVLAIGSAEPSLQKKQMLGVAAGTVIMIFISFLNYSWILKLYWIMYIGNLALLIAVRFACSDCC